MFEIKKMLKNEQRYNKIGQESQDELIKMNRNGFLNLIIAKLNDSLDTKFLQKLKKHPVLMNNVPAEDKWFAIFVRLFRGHNYLKYFNIQFN